MSQHDDNEPEQQYDESVQPHWYDYIVAVFVAFFGWGRRG